MTRLLAEFASQQALRSACGAVRAAGCRVERTFSPVPVGLVDDVSPVSRWVLGGGVLGALAGLALTIGTSLAWPLMVSAKPIVSMPPYLIIAFELCILLGALGGLVGFLRSAGMPSLQGDEGYGDNFAVDRFGVVVRCEGVAAEAVGMTLREAGAVAVTGFGRDGDDGPSPDGDDDPPKHGGGGDGPRRERDTGSGSGTGGPAAMLPSLIVLLGLTTAACGLPTPWGADMAETPAVMADEELRLPPEGTLHRAGEPLVSRFEAAFALRNPLPDQEAVLERGARLYGIYCTPCHGARGAGDGRLAPYFEARPPTDLTSARASNQTDGYIYATIRIGGGDMPAYGAALAAEERWAVVHHVRVLQRRGGR